MRKFQKGLAFLPVLLIAILVGALVYGVRNQQIKEKQKKDVAALERFLEADTKHGTYVYQATYPSEGGTRPEENAEFWIKGETKYRDDHYVGGVKRISVVATDGVPYMCGSPLGTPLCNPSPAPLSFYLLAFAKPSVEAGYAGEDRTNGCTKYLYPIKQTYSQEGASNSYHAEDLTYCISGNQDIIYAIYRGYIPEMRGEISDPNDMDVHNYKFTKIESGIEIPESTFNLPYSPQE